MWADVRGITIAEWFLGLAFTAELCLTGAPFCLSVDTKHMRQAYDQSSQCPLNNKHNLPCSVRAKASPSLYLTCTHRPAEASLCPPEKAGGRQQGMKEGLYISWDTEMEKLMHIPCITHGPLESNTKPCLFPCQGVSGFGCTESEDCCLANQNPSPQLL